MDMDTLLKRVPKNLAITCTLNHRIRRQTRWLSVIVFRLIRSGSCPNCWHKIAKCGLLYYTAYTVPMMRSYPWHCLSWATWVVSRTGLGMACPSHLPCADGVAIHIYHWNRSKLPSSYLRIASSHNLLRWCLGCIFDNIFALPRLNRTRTV